jgi:hypothetical protein
MTMFGRCRRELRTWPWQQDLVGQLDPNRPRQLGISRSDPPCAASVRPATSTRPLEFGGGQLTHPVLRCTQRDLDQDVCHVGDRTRLDQQRRHHRHLPGVSVRVSVLLRAPDMCQIGP